MKHTVFILLLFLLVACIDRSSVKNETNDEIIYTDTIAGLFKVNKKENADLNKQNIPEDTASVYYLNYLLKSDKEISASWKDKLNEINDNLIIEDIYSSIGISRIWVINDSVIAAILTHSTGVSYDTYLLTFKYERDFIDLLQIGDNADRDIGNEFYAYTEYKFLNDKVVELMNYELEGTEENNIKTTITEKWSIDDDGQIIKKQ